MLLWIAHLLLPAGGILQRSGHFAHSLLVDSTPSFTGGWHTTYKIPDLEKGKQLIAHHLYQVKTTSEFANLQKATKFIAHLLLPAGGMLQYSGSLSIIDNEPIAHYLLPAGGMLFLIKFGSEVLFLIR